MIVLRRIEPEPDPWLRWYSPRATHAVVVAETDGGASMVVLPEANGYEMLLHWSMLPSSLLPLRRGDYLSVTIRRLRGEFGGFEMNWSPSRITEGDTIP